MTDPNEVLLAAMLVRFYATDYRKANSFEVSDEEWDAAAERMEQDHDMPQLRAKLVRALVASGGELRPEMRPHFMALPLRLRGVQS